VANIFTTICATFYQNRPGFVEDVTKTFWLFFGSQCRWNSTGCRQRLCLCLLWPWPLTFWPKTLFRILSSSSYHGHRV